MNWFVDVLGIGVVVFCGWLLLGGAVAFLFGRMARGRRDG